MLIVYFSLLKIRLVLFRCCKGIDIFFSSKFFFKNFQKKIIYKDSINIFHFDIQKSLSLYFSINIRRRRHHGRWHISRTPLIPRCENYSQVYIAIGVQLKYWIISTIQIDQ